MSPSVINHWPLLRTASNRNEGPLMYLAYAHDQDMNLFDFEKLKRVCTENAWPPPPPPPPPYVLLLRPLIKHSEISSMSCCMEYVRTLNPIQYAGVALTLKQARYFQVFNFLCFVNSVGVGPLITLRGNKTYQSTAFRSPKSGEPQPLGLDTRIV